MNKHEIDDEDQMRRMEGLAYSFIGCFIALITLIVYFIFCYRGA